MAGHHSHTNPRQWTFILEFSLVIFCLWVCHWGLSLLSHAVSFERFLKSPIHGTTHTHASNPYFLSSRVHLLFCHLHPISIKPENKNPPNSSTSDKVTFIHWISFHFCGSILFMKVHPIYFHNIHPSIFIFI
jgi:hypothetical protein